MNTSTDRIERKILLKASRARVWRAISNAAEFGSWFGVDFKGKAFVAGEPVRGQVTNPGYEHLAMEVLIEKMIPEQILSWRWHPAAIDPSIDYSQESAPATSFTAAKAHSWWR